MTKKINALNFAEINTEGLGEVASNIEFLVDVALKRLIQSQDFWMKRRGSVV